jgi:hypothetical protein
VPQPEPKLNLFAIGFPRVNPSYPTEGFAEASIEISVKYNFQLPVSRDVFKSQQAAVQSVIASPGTCSKSRRLRVTTVASRERAIAAIRISL